MPTAGLATNSTAAGAKPGRILVVDDNQTNRRLLQAILARKGYRTTIAIDGEQAVQTALADPPDLILLDVMMPRKDGYQVCAELKHDPRFAEIPIVFLSALAAATDRVKGLELGAADYINKPFDIAEVLARVKTQLQISILTRDLRAANGELLRRQAQLEQDLRAARDIQTSLLPRLKSIAEPWVKADWRFAPCDQVGGDVFNVFWLDHEHLGAYVVDVSGHGVPAAMVTVAVSRSLSIDGGCTVERGVDGSALIASPGQVMRRLDQEYPIERFGKFFTIVYLVLNCRTRTLKFSCAGHPPPLLVRGDGSVQSLEAGGTIIGIGAALPFEEDQLQLRPNDRLFLYSDGITEREGGGGEVFGAQRLTDELSGSARDSLPAVCERLFGELEAFAQGAPATDDVTLCGLELDMPMPARPREMTARPST